MPARAKKCLTSLYHREKKWVNPPNEWSALRILGLSSPRGLLPRLCKNLYHHGMVSDEKLCEVVIWFSRARVIECKSMGRTHVLSGSTHLRSCNKLFATPRSRLPTIEGGFSEREVFDDPDSEDSGMLCIRCTLHLSSGPRIRVR